jgi:predicted nucleic acid-binding Zn ribbon protein
MTDPEQRTCPFCSEAIKAEAKVCPRCRQWLTLKSFRHPLVLMLCHALPMLAIWIAGTLVIYSRLEQLQNPKPYYSEFPGSLQVIESRMNWAQTRDGLRVFVVGVLTNSSSVNWRDVEFDCRFFNSGGVMVDANAGRSFFAVCPHDATAFRVSVIPTAPTNDYASFTISVSQARSGTGLF